LTTTTPQQDELAETAATQLAADNMELVCAFIQKTAIEKSIPEIDKLISSDYDMRKLARKEGRHYYDPNVLTYQSERMPEQIRLKVGGVSPQQFAVYEEFARNIPGFQPITERDTALFIPKVAQEVVPIAPFANVITQAAAAAAAAVTAHGNTFGADEIGILYDELATKMEAFLNTINVPALQVQVTNMQVLLECLIIARRTRDNQNACNLLKKAVEGLMEGLVNISEHVEQIKLYRDIHLRVMRLLQDARAFGAAWTNKAIARYMLECREEFRYNMEAVDLLISSNFVNMSQYDLMLASLIDNGNNYLAVAFAMQLVQTYFIDERPNPVLNDNDLMNTVELLARLATHPRAPEGLPHLIEMLRANHDPNTFLVDRSIAAPTSYIHSGILQARVSEIKLLFLFY
jgi:CCR4-NOT transcription complex subunit 1